MSIESDPFKVQQSISQGIGESSGIAQSPEKALSELSGKLRGEMMSVGKSESTQETSAAANAGNRSVEVQTAVLKAHLAAAFGQVKQH